MGEPHYKSEWHAMRDHYQRCLKCGARMAEALICRDHIVALSEDGDHSLYNIQPLCSSCNARKKVGDHTDWRLVQPDTHVYWLRSSDRDDYMATWLCVGLS